MQSLKKCSQSRRRFCSGCHRQTAASLKRPPVFLFCPPPTTTPPPPPLPPLVSRSLCLLSRPLRGSLSRPPFSRPVFFPAAAVTRDRSCGGAERRKKKKSQTLSRLRGGGGPNELENGMFCPDAIHFVPPSPACLPACSLSAAPSHPSPDSPVRKIPLLAPGIQK